MSVTPACLIETQLLTNAAVTLYTSVAKTIIDKLTVCNTSGGAVTVTIYIVPSGGSVGASSLIVATFSIAANTTVDMTQIQNQILEAGDFIAALASSTTVMTIRAAGRLVV